MNGFCILNLHLQWVFHLSSQFAPNCLHHSDKVFHLLLIGISRRGEHDPFLYVHRLEHVSTYTNKPNQNSALQIVP